MSNRVRFYASGGRFDETNGIPLESLSAMSAFGGLLRSIARDLFREANPHRERAPNHIDSLRPALVRVEGGGSATATLDTGSADVERAEVASLYEDAVAEVPRLLEAANADEPFPGWCSRKSKLALAAFLAVIGDASETIDVSCESNEDADDWTVKVTSTARDNAKRASRRSSTVGEEPYGVLGRICGIEKEPWSVLLRVREGEAKLRVPIAESLANDVRDLFDQDGSVIVRLQGTARRDDHGRRQRADARQLERVGGPPISARLSALGELDDEWIDDDPTAKAPSRTFCRKVERELWALVEDRGWDRPHLFPLASGGVEAMWRLGHRTVKLRYEPGPWSVSARVLNLAAQSVSASESVTSTPKLYDWLSEFMTDVS